MTKNDAYIIRKWHTKLLIGKDFSHRTSIVEEHFEQFRTDAILKIHFDNKSKLNAHVFLTFSHISINFFQT